MDRKIRMYVRRLKLDRLKPWIVVFYVFYSPILVLVFVQWTVQWFENRSRYSSVLSAASPYPFSDFFNGFMSTDCSAGGNWGALFWGDGNGFSCMIHVRLISVWLLTAGYSLAPILRKRVLPIISNNVSELPFREPIEITQESTMTEKTETNENTH